VPSVASVQLRCSLVGGCTKERTDKAYFAVVDLLSVVSVRLELQTVANFYKNVLLNILHYLQHRLALLTREMACSYPPSNTVTVDESISVECIS